MSILNNAKNTITHPIFIGIVYNVYLDFFVSGKEIDLFFEIFHF
jgi:hypothetical protein